MFISKKDFSEFQDKFYLVKSQLVKLQERIETVEENIINSEKALEEYKISSTRELNDVYKRLLSVQKDFSRKMTYDCEKDNLLEMIEDLREKVDVSLSKLCEEISELRKSGCSKDETDKSIASIMDEYLNGGNKDD